ncbi:Exonuclease SbcC [hydrothermal vent metagenome]|uniref:Exonuclease SbcC n=1 Tax=hydrothermal vent metagenome TaxID=652676 RepID=A0A3B0W4T9_9ZZZZ
MGKIQIMCKKRLTSRIITATLCLFFLTPLQAGVYKWVDDNGQVHYGERRGNVDAEKVTIRQNETTKPRVIEKTEEDIKAEKEKAKKEAEKAKEPEKPKISKKNKRKYCNEAKGDLTAINSRGRMREINAKGEYNYLTEKQRQQRIKAAQKKQRKFCR